MARTHSRIRIGSVTLRMLAGMLLAVSLLGATFAASSAQGIPGLPGGYGQGDWEDESWDDEGDWGQGGALNPGELCYAVFPDGIISGDPVVGDVDCSTIFGGGHPTEEPTEEPTWEPTEEPTWEPTKEPTYEPDHDHDYDKKHDHDYNKHDHDKKHDYDYNTHEGGKKDVGGKAAPTVTTMPSTGTGAASDGNAMTAGMLAAVALALAMLSGVMLRLTGVRIPRR